MNNLTRKLSVMIKGSVCLLGLVSVGNLLVTPANASQASARGAVTVVRPSGSSISVSGELDLPDGLYFPGPLTITPSGSGTVGGNDESITSLKVDPGTTTVPTSGAGNAFVQAAAAKLTSAATVQDEAALIKAGSGTNGLGALP
jgi:hypothetical protein